MTGLRFYWLRLPFDRKHMEITMSMCGFSRDGLAIHKTTVILVVILYVIVASAVDLFHTGECQVTPTDTAHKHVIFNGDQCPACTFLAGHSSTGASHVPGLVIAECLLISQFSHCVAVVQHNEWDSIASRAPPLPALL